MTENVDTPLFKINDPQVTAQALEKFSKMGSIQAKISAKILEVFAEVLDEDLIDALVNKEINEYFTQEHLYQLDSIKVFSKTHLAVPENFDKLDWTTKDRLVKANGEVTELKFLNRKVTQFRQDIWSLIQPYVLTYVKTQLEEKDSEISKEIDQQLASKREDILQGKVNLTVGLASLMSQNLIDSTLRTANAQATAMLTDTVQMLPFDQKFVNNLEQTLKARGGGRNVY